MDIKTIPACSALYFSTETSLQELSAYIGNVAAELYKAATAVQLLPSGPVTWIYYGADGKPDTRFTLEIALPVQGVPTAEAAYPLKSLPVFSCASAVHYGSWNSLGDTYQKMIPTLFQQGKKMSGISREQYIQIDFDNPVNNITEVQIGL